MTIKGQGGEHISAVAQRAVDEARICGEGVSFDFNGVELTAHPGTIVADLVAEYGRICEERRAAYVASLDHKRRRKEAERKEPSDNGNVAICAQCKHCIGKGWHATCRQRPLTMKLNFITGKMEGHICVEGEWHPAFSNYEKCKDHNLNGTCKSFEPGMPQPEEDVAG